MADKLERIKVRRDESIERSRIKRLEAQRVYELKENRKKKEIEDKIMVKEQSVKQIREEAAHKIEIKKIQDHLKREEKKRKLLQD